MEKNMEKNTIRNPSLEKPVKESIIKEVKGVKVVYL
jgi:hypothetical protein